MAKVRHLARAPIQEAILDFEFSGPGLSQVQIDSISSRYVKSGSKTKKIEMPVVAPPPLAVGGIDVPGGKWNYISLEEHVGLPPSAGRSVLISQNQVAVSSVRSYPGWDEFEVLAERAFSSYVELAENPRVTRLSARFINRIAPDPTYADYSSILERPPQSLPGEGLEGSKITDFLRRHVVDGLRGNFTANLTVGTATPEPLEITKNTKAILIDIDVFKMCDLAADFVSLRSELATMREIKNALFFGSLKEHVVERYI
ncbi:MAG: TIGR04255 family protein [Rhodanobacteraceae bacterium]|nr:TIGR04255 family protein [Rhodanobacteraceae bacterium]